MQRQPLKNNHLAVYFLDDSLLVWHHPSDSLHSLKGLECWVLLGLDEGLTPTQLLEEYYLSNNPQTPTSDECLLALIASIVPLLNAQPLANTYCEEYVGVSQQPINPEYYGQGFYCYVNHLQYQVVSDVSVIIEQLQSLCVLNTIAQSRTVDCQFEIIALTNLADDNCAQKAQPHYQIRCNGVVLENSTPENTLLPLLMDYMQILNYQSRDYLLAIHAAALVKGNKALILPGVSGSGKSTLCVSLLQQGFEVYSDELAVLDANTAQVQPLPLPMAVKTGSWPILQTEWPSLSTTPIWQRPDGRQLKYLPLPALPEEKPTLKQQYIVFPQYNATHIKPECQKLNPLETLTKLTQAGYQLKSGLSEKKIEQLIHLAENTPAYTLSYANLKQAHDCLGLLLE